MFTKSLKEVAEIAGAMATWGKAEVQVRGVFTDTRNPVAGGLFIALKGPNFDGHDYLLAAFQGGASAALVSRPEVLGNLKDYRDRGVAMVPDTREGYLRLAASHRNALSRTTWFGITGSAGKTSTKELLAQILATAGRRVHRAQRSFNNEVGLAATILAAEPEHDAVVLELGTNHPGEIARLAAVARPDIAILTNAGAAHLEAFKTVGGVATEKAHILDFQSAEGTAVLNADDEFFRQWEHQARGAVITFGLTPAAEVRGELLAWHLEGTYFRLHIGGRQAEVQLSIPGRHGVSNALAAAAAAHKAGVPFDAIVAGLEASATTERRFDSREIGGVTLVDDAYNANPLSFRAALDTVRSCRARRLFIVAGDMLELGDTAQAFHRDLGKDFAAAHPACLCTVGPWATVAGQAALDAGLPGNAWTRCESPGDAAVVLGPLLEPGDMVLVKGSHGMHLEQCVVRLAQYLEARAAVPLAVSAS